MPRTRLANLGRVAEHNLYDLRNLKQTTGNIIFVDSNAASGGNGLSPEAAVLTIDAAIGLCTANNGDVIVVMEGHAETLTAAAGIDADVAGISIIGLGNGSDRPQITLGTIATVDIDIDAANVTLENLDFIAAVDDIAAAIDVNAAECTIRNCRFLEPTADKNFVIAILGATSTTSNRLTVENCRFESVDAANTAAISLPGTSNGCVIKDNFIQGFYETSAILAAGAVTRIEVTGNLIQNTDTDADACINLAASSTGIVAYNGVGAALAADATTNILCNSGVVLIQNFSVDTGDRQGVLDPAAT